MLELLIKNEDTTLFEKLSANEDNQKKNDQLRILGLMSMFQTMNH